MSEAVEMPVPSWLPERALTEDDLALMPDDGHRYEIIDGSLFVSPPPSMDHQIAVDCLSDLLKVGCPADVRLLQGLGVRIGRSYLIPDLMIVRRDARRDLTCDPRDVLLAVEVVSPSSVGMDRLLKPATYASAGIAHYWRVEPLHSEGVLLAVHCLNGAEYELVGTAVGDDELHIERPFPVTVRPSALLE